jgi:chorismate dehydratase
VLKITILDRKIKVSAVSYLNTKPLLYGINNAAFEHKIILELDYPAIVAQKLRTDAADIGLVPIGALPNIPNARIISDYGIGADGKVASVCIFSKVPMEAVETVYLDYQSRTSVKLAQLLLKHYWKKKIAFLPAPENFISLIEGPTAGVIIGDRALENLQNFEYVYDLAEHWKRFTGLPFVFAAWVANKDLPAEFITTFNEANAYGINHLDAVIAQLPTYPYDLKKYYSEDIQYFLDEEKHKGIQLFLQYLDRDHFE